MVQGAPLLGSPATSIHHFVQTLYMYNILYISRGAAGARCVFGLEFDVWYLMYDLCVLSNLRRILYEV